MKRLLLLASLVGCGAAPAASPEHTAAPNAAELRALQQRVASLEKRLDAVTVSREAPKAAYPLTRDELKFLIDKGTGRDYVKLTTTQREYFSEFLSELMKAKSPPQEIKQYLDGIYDGSQPAIMNQTISEMAAAGITMMEASGAVNRN